MKIVILYSAGLDSFIMKKLAEKEHPEAEILCVYYEHGAPSALSEISLLPDDVIIKNIDWLNENNRPVSKKSNPLVGPIYIPGRNMVFAALAASQFLPDEVWLGPLIDECNDLATDKNNQFKGRMNYLLKYVLSPFVDDVKLVFPFVDRKWTKVDCVKWALDNGVTQEEILNTVSCSFDNGIKPCGECFQCLKRRLVMINCGIDVVESYTDPMYNSFGISIMKNIEDLVKSGNQDPDNLNMLNMIETAREVLNAKNSNPDN